jgi:SET domain-containing protein
MLLVDTKLDRSAIDGIGLFAVDFIPRGTVIWSMSEVIDRALTPAELNALSEPALKQVRKYSYFDADLGKYVFCGDDARFFNHSDEPNCVDVSDGPNGGLTIAARDIYPGEELTCDYSLFDAEFQSYAVEVSKSGNGRPSGERANDDVPPPSFLCSETNIKTNI